MSTPLTREEVAKVARLARLTLTEAELDRFTTQLAQVVEYVGVLDEVDTDSVDAPMAHPLPLTNVLRDDAPGGSLSREDALANAPHNDGEYFLVPPIL